ncbi:protein NLRC3-like [Mugil cephalus]|uniref:protein NLRC3-like n=1 Tax=Mugil cephalus TaxID=48193 RepID=UPI001FB72818|nr:protein NLRC3-like [Mugil cephalus]
MNVSGEIQQGPSSSKAALRKQIDDQTGCESFDHTFPLTSRKRSEVTSHQHQHQQKHLDSSFKVCTTDVSEEREDGGSTLKAALSEQNDGETGKNSQMNLERLDSPVPGLSRRSVQSMHLPLTFEGGDERRSRKEPIEFNNKQHSVTQSQVNQERPDSPVAVSFGSWLEEDIVSFAKQELNRLKKLLNSESPEGSENLREDAGEEQRTSDRDAFLKITLNFLRRKKQEQLANTLQRKTYVPICQGKLKSNLKRKFQCVFEGIARAGNPTLLSQIYTELYITEGERKEVSDQHEVRQIEAASGIHARSATTVRCEDLFKPLPGRNEPVRTVLTKGVAGIGKSVLTQKFTLDWAEDKANKDIQLIFPFTFRELSLLKEKKFNLVELVHHFFTDIKEPGICSLEKFEVVFIFDGLDECRLPLDFHNTEILTDVTESTSLDALLTNLIRGKLLPSAHLWITTRPVAANRIPPEYVDMVTEVRGFKDPQKEMYFRKRFRDEEQASRIISHIKASRNLHTMCHIPVFCWITATVLDHMLKTKDKAEQPKTLTEMYIHFLLVQTKLSNVKYHKEAERDEVWNKKTKKTILALGKLAFEQLYKGNLIFYETDLKDCDINITSASVYSGLFTEIFKQESGITQAKVFSFVHQSLQEFLAALYVFVMIINTGEDMMRGKRLRLPFESKLKKLYRRAVDNSLQSPNGHLDLFVRFLLGLSLDTNQTLLRGLLTKTVSKPQFKEVLVQYIKKKIRETPPPERSINLFHCLNELNDHTLEEEIQQSLRSGSFFKNKPTPSQWSALGFILLSSQKDLDVFDMKKFFVSKELLQWLLPVVKGSKKSLLSDCNLSWSSCEVLVPVLTSKHSNLRELDLSNNDLQNEGVQVLSAGIRNPECRLEILRLSGCLVTEEGCNFLASALSSNPSHLRELDLSYNPLEESDVMQLSAGLKDPNWKLEILKTDHCGKCRRKPSLFKYFCELELDPNTADSKLLLSACNKNMQVVIEKQRYPKHPERFEGWKQLLCSEGLTGRCYWEVQWSGSVSIGVTYKGIRRKGKRDDCCIGWNDQSWCVSCSRQGFTAWHNKTPSDIKAPPPIDSSRVAVYLDWDAGTLSFYSLPNRDSFVKRIHLHTFYSTFSEPLYPAFGFERTPEVGTESTVFWSSVSLSPCDGSAADQMGFLIK